MGYRSGDDTITFEAKVYYVTAKARLVDITIGGEVWLPKSQTIDMSDADPDENCMFVVTGWWAGKNGLK